LQKKKENWTPDIVVVVFHERLAALEPPMGYIDVLSYGIMYIKCHYRQQLEPKEWPIRQLI
jgi:hypothetical protein